MVEVITFPRSGHHWLMRCLEQRCNLHGEWHCDAHKAKPTPETLVLKHHDFSLDYRPKRPFLVQARADVIASLQSWFDLYVRDGYSEDTQECWSAFAGQKVVFAAAWYRKWVKHYNGSVIFYERLLEDIDTPINLLADRLKLVASGDLQTEIHTPRNTSSYRHATDAVALNEAFKAIYHA